MPSGNTTTSGENPASALNGTELVRGVQGGSNVKMTTAAIAALGYQPPLSTKGDLIVQGAVTGGRLPVGSDGQTVYADSGQALGMRWGAPGVSTTDLANNTSASKGVGLIGNNPTLNYVAGTLGCHLGVEWNPQDYPWLAAFDGTTDDTAAINACAAAILAAGGGVMRCPKRKIAAVTALSVTWASKSTPLHVKDLTVQKIGSTTTPALSLTATGYLDVYSSLENVRVLGASASHPGVLATDLASFTTKFLQIEGCGTAYHAMGNLVTTHYDAAFRSNLNGYVCEKSASGVYANAVIFVRGSITNNTNLGISLDGCSGVKFLGTNVEQNGTSGNNATGNLYTASTIAAETGFSVIHLDTAHFESSLGTNIAFTAASGLNVVMAGVEMLNSQSGRALVSGAIGSITMIGCNAPSPGDTVTLAGACSTVIGGTINTLTDSCTQQSHINVTGSVASLGSYLKSAQIGTGGMTLDPSAVIRDSTGVFSQGAPIATFRDGGLAGNAIGMFATNGTGGNAAACALRIGAHGVNSRGANVGGSVNVNGADYAEYEFKRADCSAVEAGRIIGFDAAGLVTDKFSLAFTFGVKSTAPAIVGGDTWFTDQPPDPPPAGASDEALAAYAVAMEAFEAAMETARQRVDRIAYTGKVPVNVLGATPGQFILAADDGAGGIKGVASDVDGPTCVGRVRTVLADGRAQLVVRSA